MAEQEKTGVWTTRLDVPGAAQRSRWGRTRKEPRLKSVSRSLGLGGNGWSHAQGCSRGGQLSRAHLPQQQERNCEASHHIISLRSGLMCAEAILAPKLGRRGVPEKGTGGWLREGGIIRALEPGGSWEGCVVFARQSWAFWFYL